MLVDPSSVERERHQDRFNSEDVKAIRMEFRCALSVAFSMQAEASDDSPSTRCVQTELGAAIVDQVELGVMPSPDELPVTFSVK